MIDAANALSELNRTWVSGPCSTSSCHSPKYIVPRLSRSMYTKKIYTKIICWQIEICTLPVKLVQNNSVLHTALEYTIFIPDWLMKKATSSLKIGVFLSRKSDESSTITGNSVSSSTICLVCRVEDAWLFSHVAQVGVLVMRFTVVYFDSDWTYRSVPTIGDSIHTLLTFLCTYRKWTYSKTYSKCTVVAGTTCNEDQPPATSDDRDMLLESTKDNWGRNLQVNDFSFWRISQYNN